MLLRLPLRKIYKYCWYFWRAASLVHGDLEQS